MKKMIMLCAWLVFPSMLWAQAIRVYGGNWSDQDYSKPSAVIEEPKSISRFLSSIHNGTEALEDDPYSFRYTNLFSWSDDTYRGAVSVSKAGIELYGITKDEAIWLLLDTIFRNREMIEYQREKEQQKYYVEENLIPPPVIYNGTGYIPLSLIDTAKMPPCNADSITPSTALKDCLSDGSTNCLANTIKVNRSSPDKSDTVLHEVMHYALGCYRAEGMETQHQFIAELTPKLLIILRRNPELVRYLMDSDLLPIQPSYTRVRTRISSVPIERYRF